MCVCEMERECLYLAYYKLIILNLQAHTENFQVCTGALVSQLIERLSKTESFEDKQVISEQLQTVVLAMQLVKLFNLTMLLNSFGIFFGSTNVSKSDLDFFCQLLSEKDSTIVILLRLFSALSSLQKR